jgi:putative endonuclease
MIHVYVLEGTHTGKRYVGITGNLDQRLQQHRHRRTKGGQIIGDFIVLHLETQPDYSTAREREKYLKSGKGREWLNERYPRTIISRTQ